MAKKIGFIEDTHAGPKESNVTGKKGFLESKHVESAFGIGGRAVLKKVINQAMVALEKASPVYFQHLAWIFISTEDRAKGFRQAFQGGLIGTAWLGENLADSVKGLPDMVKEVVEIFFGDLPGALSDYFDTRRTSIVFPADYHGPTTEDMEKLIAEVKKVLNQAFTGTLKNLPGFLQGMAGHFTPGHTHRFLEILVNSGDDAIDSFMVFVKRNMETPDQTTNQKLRDALVEIVEHHPDSLVPFLALSTDRQDGVFQLSMMLKEHQLFPRLVRQAKENWPAVVAHINRGRSATAGQLASWSDQLVVDNVVRRQEIETERSGRPQPKKKSRIGWRGISFLAIAAFVLGTLIAVGVSYWRQPIPRISITNAQSTTVIHQPDFTVSGMAEASDRVSQVEAQVNQGPRIKLFIWSGPQAQWRWEYHNFQPGRNQVTIYAKDGRGKVAEAHITILYQPE